MRCSNLGLTTLTYKDTILTKNVYGGGLIEWELCILKMIAPHVTSYTLLVPSKGVEPLAFRF